MRSWRRVFTSAEAEIEALAGASPAGDCPPWECARDAHEFVTSGECHGMLYRECRLCGFPEHKLDDWPQRPKPAWPPEDEAKETP